MKVKVPAMKVRQLTLAVPSTSPVLALGVAANQAFAYALEERLWLYSWSKPVTDAVFEAALRDLMHQKSSPRLVICDLDSASKGAQMARRLALSLSITRREVSAAEAMLLATAEQHKLDTSAGVLGLVLDSGMMMYDGSEGGGEAYTLRGSHVERVAHLLPVGLPGDHYVYDEPYRMMLSYLWETFGDVKVDRLFRESVSKLVFHDVWELIKNRHVSHTSTSLMRLIEAIWALISGEHVLKQRNQATVLLEKLAKGASSGTKTLPFELEHLGHMVIADTRPLFGKLVERIAREVPHADLARGAMLTIAEMIGEMLQLVGGRTNKTLLFAGDMAAGSALSETITAQLHDAGYEIVKSRFVREETIAYGQVLKAFG